MDNLQVQTTVVPEPSGSIRLALVMVDAAIETFSWPCAEHHFGRLGAIGFFLAVNHDPDSVSATCDPLHPCRITRGRAAETARCIYGASADRFHRCRKY